MKLMMLVLSLLLSIAPCVEAGRGRSYGQSSSSAVRVKGYTTKNGTYVQPHMRSKSNSTDYDNWSTKGNTNPYTGKKGTKEPGY